MTFGQGLSAVSRLSFTLSIAAFLFSFVFGIDQPGLEQLEAEARPIRATLITTEVQEWMSGQGNWAAIGTFDIESGNYQGRGQGTLNPPNKTGSRRRKISREQAEQLERAWEIGRTYDAFHYPDKPEQIFFKLPGANENARRIWCFRIAAGVFLVVGLVSAGIVNNLPPTPKPLGFASDPSRTSHYRS